MITAGQRIEINLDFKSIDVSAVLTAKVQSCDNTGVVRICEIVDISEYFGPQEIDKSFVDLPLIDGITIRILD